MKKSIFIKYLLTLSLPLLLCQCSSWMGDSEPTKLEGTRIKLLDTGTGLKASTDTTPITLSPPQEMASWLVSGGNTTHNLGNVAWQGGLQQIWRTSIGSATNERYRILTQPVASHDTIYTINPDGVVTALNRANGNILWAVDTYPEEEDGITLSGGLALGRDYLFVTTPIGQVLALEIATGKTIWQQTVDSPIRSAPTLFAEKLFVLTTENQLIAFAQADGAILWSHSGLPEQTSILGGASPVLHEEVIIAPYSSGELVGLHTQNGYPIWSEVFTTTKPLQPFAELAEIKGNPVTDGTHVYAASFNGVMSATSLRYGARIWSQDISSAQTPWLSGNALFVITTEATLLALNKENGNILWVESLPRFEDEAEKKGLIRWFAPFISHNTLYIMNANGDLISSDPKTGARLSQITLPVKPTTNPIIVDNTLYILDQNGDLSAYK